MILFFDRSVGVRIPRAIRFLKPPPPIKIKFHDECFSKNELDDCWLPTIGAQDWFVIGFDYSFHGNASELAAIKQYSIGCFYLWGANAPRWESFRVLARAFDRIVEKAANTPKPFLYRIEKSSRITRLTLP